MRELTDSGVLLRLAYQALRKAGIDADAVLARCGADLLQLEDPRLRTPVAAQDSFWRAVSEVSGDAHIGLLLARHLPRFRGQVIEYLFSSSSTFGEGLRRALQYQRLLSDAMLGRFEHQGELSYLASGSRQHEPAPLAECMMAGIIQFFAQVTDGEFQPHRVWLRHPAGAAVADYEAVYGCPVEFSQTENRLYFASTILERTFWHAEPELLKLHMQVATEKLAELERLDLVADVRRVIAQILESGDVSLESVARQLELRPRALRSRLAEVGTSFNHILNDYRSRLARRLLAKTDESIDQIVYLTGFSEPSTFYRAFRRWTSETPVEYRRRKRASISS